MILVAKPNKQKKSAKSDKGKIILVPLKTQADLVRYACHFAQNNGEILLSKKSDGSHVGYSAAERIGDILLVYTHDFPNKCSLLPRHMF